MSLLQNDVVALDASGRFDYQSECHCSKTSSQVTYRLFGFDYQSECHCSKTAAARDRRFYQFDYQSECHCSKTAMVAWMASMLFDYQSECHCSKTSVKATRAVQAFDYQSECHCSKTSSTPTCRPTSLTTSQNVTAPKPLKQILFCGRGVLSDQFVASYSIKCWSTTTFLSN